jgi:hypothetical protein
MIKQTARTKQQNFLSTGKAIDPLSVLPERPSTITVEHKYIMEDPVTGALSNYRESQTKKGTNGKMKKLISLTFLFLFFPIFISSAEATIDLSIYAAIINEMFVTMNTIVEKNGNADNVINTYTVAKTALDNNLVKIEIDPGGDMILSGMYFSRNIDTNVISLIFGKKFLDTYRQDSSIHYSILIHELRHLHDYIENKEAFTNAANDEKEKYWYELDALHIEAEFIKYYLVDNYTLSKFENYLLYSFEHNSLDAISAIMKKESRNTFFYFDKFENQYKSDNSRKNDILQTIIEDGNQFIAEYNVGISDSFLCYMTFITLSTFRKYLIRFMSLIVNDPAVTWGEVFAQYPAVAGIITEIEEIQSKDIEKQNAYLHTVFNHWENDFNTRYMVEE